MCPQEETNDLVSTGNEQYCEAESLNDDHILPETSDGGKN